MQPKRRPLTEEERKIAKQIGLRISQFRKRNGITQAQLAERLKVSQAMVSIYEKGLERVPITQFIIIAQTIGVSPGEILEGIDQIPENNRVRLSRRFSKRLEEIENLPAFEKRTLIKTIDAVLFQHKAQKKGTAVKEESPSVV